MGGSGGGFDPLATRTEIREFEKAIDDSRFEAEVAGFLGGILAEANARDAAVTQAHLKTIKAAIEKEVDGFVELLFGGSVAKNTYVEGVSDVDALVLLDKSNLADETPLDARDHIIARLQERLPGTQIEPDGFAVSVKYADGVVQLVPAKRHGDDLYLPSADCREWSRIRPAAFTEALTAANRDLNGKVVPTIKLAKAALSEVPKERRPSGYHLESLALEIFENYHGPRTPKDMVAHFFANAWPRVLAPIPDRTGQSRNVDDYLGLAGSLERQIVSDTLGRIARRLQNADGVRSLEQWKRIFGVE